MRSLLVISCVAAALACGKDGSDRPRDVIASATASGVDVTWSGSAGSYRVQLVDLDSGSALSQAVTVHGTHVLLPGAFAQGAGVWVDAVPGGRAYGFVSAGASGGSAGAWQMFGPQDFRDGELHADFTSLAPGERLGVLLVNAGGRDGADVDVAVSGVDDTIRPQASGFRPQALVAAGPSRSATVHAPEAAVPARVATAEAAPVGDHRAFCVVPGLDFSRHVRKPATRVASSEHGEFWVDDEDLSHYEAPFFDALKQAYEDRVWPADTQTFGMPTDVDKNGRILVLLSHELGVSVNGGWLIGYFGNGDLLNARDADCSGSGSNHAEIVYLNDVRNGGANGYSAADLQGTIFPATLAHEIQHLLNLGHRCVEKSCDGPEATWVNEALSKVAEDLAGYGWNSAIGRSEGASYLSRGSYDGRSLTKWEGDPIGNYQGAHSFMRYFADRLGNDLAGSIGRGAAVEDALGRPLPRAMGEWASALLLSNEPGASYNFSGSAWSPLHERLRHLEYRAPGAASVRSDGIAAFVSGAGTGAAAQVTVRTSEHVAPHVVVLRVPGDLPP